MGSSPFSESYFNNLKIKQRNKNRHIAKRLLMHRAKNVVDHEEKEYHRKNGIDNEDRRERKEDPFFYRTGVMVNLMENIEKQDREGKKSRSELRKRRP